MWVVLEFHALGDLNSEGIAWYPTLPQDPEYIGLDLRLAELGIGHIDTEMKPGMGPPPLAALLQSLPQHPQSHRADELAVLQNGDKLGGLDGAAPGGIEPEQGLRSVQIKALRPHLSLKLDGKSLKLRPDRSLQLFLEFDSCQLPLIILRGEKAKAVFPPQLRSIQGTLRILEESIALRRFRPVQLRGGANPCSEWERADRGRKKFRR